MHCQVPLLSTELKYADVKTVFKKDVKTDKENYWPISILPTLSKKNLYEKLIYTRIYLYFDKVFQSCNVVSGQFLILSTA